MAAPTGHGETRWRKVRMDDEQWTALGQRAEADGISASEALRRLAARYAAGKVQAGPPVPAYRPGGGFAAITEAGRQMGDAGARAVQQIKETGDQ